jgi:hypothetical protein
MDSRVTIMIEPDNCGQTGQHNVIPTTEPAVRRCQIPAEARLRGSRNGARVAAERRREAACDEDDGLWPLIFQLRSEGQSLQRIAEQLSRDGIVTRQGCRYWHAAQVQRIIDRTLDRAADLAAELEEDLESLRIVYRRELGQEIPEVDDEPEDVAVMPEASPVSRTG